MAGTKKVKGAAKAKAAKGKDRSKPAGKDDSSDAQPRNASDAQAPKAPVAQQPQPLPNNPERVERVKALWKLKTQEERVELLTVLYDDVVKAAKDADEPYKNTATDVDDEVQTVSYEEILVGGMERKRRTGTWKEWSWPGMEETFTSQEDFRAFLEKLVYPTALQKYLPREVDARAAEPPAEAALRRRMAELWKEVNESLRVFQEQVAEGSVKLVPAKHGQRRTRPTQEEITEATKQHHIEMIIKMMAVLSEEHDLLYASLSHPVMLFVCTTLADTARETRHSGELFFEDLQKLGWEDVVQVSEWLLEKVDGLAAQWKDNRDEDSDDNQHLADVDLFAITEDDRSLQVHPVWLTHLQERVMGPDGNPHKSSPQEDPEQVGLVLEWVYGCIVSTAEKARENAKRHLHPLHPPDATQAWQLLLTALKEQQGLEEQRAQAKELLREMLLSRQKAHDLTVRFQLDKKPVAPPKSSSFNGSGADGDQQCVYSEKEFPNWVISELLEREKLLTSAKLHVLKQTLEQGLRTVRLQRYKQRQGEPVFERLKKNLEDVKNAHRGLDGNYRSTAEMDRQRQVMADQAIEEQLHAQTAFRQQGAHLQSVVNKLHAQEVENRKLDQEMKQLHSWKQTIASVIHRLEEHIATVAAERAASPDPDGDASGEHSLSGHGGGDAVDKRIVRLRNQFFEEMRKQLYSEEEDKYFYSEVQKGIKAVEARLEEGEVVISQLEAQLLNVACDDPGSTVGMALLLPILCDRLDHLAQEHAAQLAAQAEQELILLNEEQERREREEREKKKQAKLKAKERLKVGKDKDRAEREAKEIADRTAAEDEAKRLAEAEQSEKAKKLQAIEALRREEEEMLERRRQELLNEEGGFWRQRMEQEMMEQHMLVVSMEEAKETTSRSNRSSMDGPRRRGDGVRPSPNSRDGALAGPRDRDSVRPGGGRGRRDFGTARPSRDGERRPLRDDMARGGRGHPGSRDASYSSHSAGPRRHGYEPPQKAPSAPAPIAQPPGGPALASSQAPAGAPMANGAAPEPAAPSQADSAPHSSASAPAVPERPAYTARPAPPAPRAPLPSSAPAAPQPRPSAPAPSPVRAPMLAPRAPLAAQQPAAFGGDHPGAGPRPSLVQPAATAPRPQAQRPLLPGAPQAQPAPLRPPAPLSAPAPGLPMHQPSRPPVPLQPRPETALRPPLQGPQPLFRAPRPSFPQPAPVPPLGLMRPDGPHAAHMPAQLRQPLPMPTPEQLKAIPNGVMGVPPLRPEGTSLHGSQQMSDARASPRPDGPPHLQSDGAPGNWHPPGLQQPPMQRATFPQPLSEVRPQAKPAVLANAGVKVDAARPDASRQPSAGPGPAPGAAGAMHPALAAQFRPPVAAQLPQPHGGAPMPQFPAGMLPPGMGAAAQLPPANAAPPPVRVAGGPGPGGPGADAAPRPAARPLPHPMAPTSIAPPNLNGATLYPPYGNAPHLFSTAPLSSMGPMMGGAPMLMQPGMPALPQNAAQPAGPMMYPQQAGPQHAQHASGQPGAQFSGSGHHGGVAPTSPSQQNVGMMPPVQHMLPPGMMPVPLQMQYAMQGGMQRPGVGMRPMKGLSAGAAAFIPREPSASARMGDRASSEASTCTNEASDRAAARDAASTTVEANSAASDASRSASAAQVRGPPQPGADAAAAAASTSANVQAPPPGMRAPPLGIRASDDGDATSSSADTSGPDAAGKQARPRAAPQHGVPPPPPHPRSAGQPSPSHPGAGPQPGAPPARPPGGVPNGLNGAAAAHASSLAKLSHDHGERLRLTRKIGLINETGQHNCFLNVIVQALWHLPAFARGLMAMQPDGLRGKESCAQEWKLLNALQKLFNAFHAATDVRGPPPAARDGQPALSPEELRRALPDKLFKRFEMHDAGEVLHEIFQALHVAEVGKLDVDPTLPARALVDVPTRKPKAGTWAAKAASQAPRSNGSTALPPPSSFVHRIFGLQVQVPVPGRPLVGEVPGQQLFEVERYFKYFHHVTTHCLVRGVHAAVRAGAPFSWSALVRQAAVESEARRDGAAQSQLLSRPAVLSLALVWDTVQAGMDSVACVVDAMRDCRQLSLSDLFAGVAPPCEYRLRCIICYFRHHYNAVVFSDEEEWLLFDDSHIEKPGDWEAILARMKSGWQPSILFYEAVAADNQ